MHCGFCHTKIEGITFDLGNTAVSNALIDKDSFHKKEAIYPLILYTCPNCLLVQIEEQEKSDNIFDCNYVYFSSLSSYWLKHAKKYSDDIISRLNLIRDSFVVEIASNDGYLLTNFVDKGIKCLGVEPTKGTADKAIEKGVPTLIEFFNLPLAKDMRKESGGADLIIANNVLAHVPDINDFMSAFKELLKPEGTITIEFPHALKMFENNEFDTIYHEHYYYFSIYALQGIFHKHGLSIYDVDEIDTHGGSLRTYVTHKGNSLDNNFDKIGVDSVLNKEIKYGLNTVKYYDKIKNEAFKIKLNFLNYIIEEKKKGTSIAAFGAAAKGNTFLNYCGIKGDIIDFVVDETPCKIGKFLPQSKIPIVTIDKMIEEKPEVIIILPWNHKKEILFKLKFTKEWNAKIVTFIPEMEIH